MTSAFVVRWAAIGTSVSLVEEAPLYIMHFNCRSKKSSEALSWSWTAQMRTIQAMRMPKSEMGQDGALLRVAIRVELFLYSAWRAENSYSLDVQ